MKYRDLARMQRCMVRLPEVCNFNPETTVLAHYRLAGTCGMGMKPHDLIGAWACSACHDVIDGRRRVEHLDRDTLDRYHLEGMARTIDSLARQGKLKS